MNAGRRIWISLASSALLLAALAFTPGALAQAGRGSISGTVTDASKAVIPGARVVISPGNIATATNATGNYTVSGLAVGTYTVTITAPGFSPLTETVTVRDGESQTLSDVLVVGSATEQVVVTAGSGPTQTMTQAVNQEITSANILNVLPESEIVALPNANIADAVGRMPGVTLQRDEGEGEYIQVRGLDPRLTNVTIDGVTVPAPEVAIQQVDLATIPDDMVQSIELNKTLSANQDADGIGGSVNLVTKTAGTVPYLSMETTMGYTPIENTRYLGKLDATAGMRFGRTQRLGLIVGLEGDYNGRGINDIEPSPDINPDGSTVPYYDGVTLREYRYDRQREGATSSLDYKLSEHSTIALHFMLSNFRDYGDKWYYAVNTLGKPKVYESLRRPDLAVGTLNLDGNHIFNNSWVHWGSAVSRSREVNAGGDPVAEWSPSSALKKFDEANCNYIGTPTSIYRPMWSSVCMFPNPNPADDTFNPQNYTLSEFRTTSGQAVELNLQEWAGMGFNYHLGGLSSTFEFGGEFRNSHAFEYAYTPYYDYSGSATVATFQSGFTDPHYYDGTYHNGPFTSWDKLNAYFHANPQLFTLDIGETAENSDSANFDLIERISAGYVMNTIDWPKFRLQTGFRTEGTQVRALGYYVSTDANGNWLGTTPETTTQSYVLPLPSVQARWQVASLTAIRAVYSRGVARPNPYDLVPYILDNGPDTLPRYTIGNPNERPTHANNYDLLLEQELRPFGVIQTGYFYKQLSDPIVSVYSACTIAGSLCNFAGGDTNPDDNNAPYVAQQNINAGNASVWGLEFSWQQRLSTLPGALRGLGMMANYSYADSHTNRIPGRTDSPSLIGTARNAFNIEPSYEYGRFQLHTGISYNGANDNAYQWFNNQPDPANNTPGPSNGPLGDNFFYPHLQVDAQAGARLWHGLQLHVDGLNLTNEVFGFYDGQPQYMTQREYYKPSYSASLRWTSGAER